MDSILQKLQTVNKTYLALSIFAVFVLLFYGITLQNGFVADDTKQIPENEYIRSLEYIPKAFTSCIWESANKGCYGRSFYYRPLHFLSNIFTYQISSQAWMFHLVNLLYTFALAALIFLLAKKLTKDYIASLAAAIIFISHPINTEVIGFASAVPDLLYGIFTVFGVLLYITYRQKKSTRSLVGVYIVYTLGVLSKEPAILVPIMYVLLDLVFFRIPLRGLFQFSELRKYLVFPAIVLVYLFARNAVLGVGPQLGDLSVAERVYAFATLFSQYVGKLFFPYPLALYHSYEQSSNLLSTSFLTGFAVVGFFVAAIWYLFRKKKSLYVFGLTWFGLFLSPVLILLGGVGENAFSERYMFVPMIGFVLIAGAGLAYAFRSPKIPRAVTAGVFLLLIAVSWVVVAQRNQDWKDNISLFTKTLEQNPDSHIVRRELGEIYLLKGDLEAAKTEFEYLVTNAPDWRDITMAYKGLGDYYRLKGDADQAILYYEQSAATGNSPRDYVAHQLLGTMYMEREQYLKAFSSFCYSLGLYDGNQLVQQNFNSALSLIDMEYIQTGTLHEQTILQLNKSPIEKLVYRDSRCTEENCEYAFSFRADQQIEALLPFLISAVTSKGTQVEITPKSFDPETGAIVLQTDKSAEGKTISFLFPNCLGVYYEASTATQP